MSSIFTLSIVQSALELGCIYSLVALALFISFTILKYGRSFYGRMFYPWLCGGAPW